MPRAEIDNQVGAMAKVMRLTRQINWPAERLSVNELQRLAIGRSAIIKPNIFLLDEPLSNLDAAFRAEMRTELKHLQHELQQTMVYVTHDQLEAMSMADRIAIMDLGFLQQYGTPLEVYNKPVNIFVARFVGAPSMNLMPCRIVSDNGNRQARLRRGRARYRCRATTHWLSLPSGPNARTSCSACGPKTCTLSPRPTAATVSK